MRRTLSVSLLALLVPTAAGCTAGDPVETSESVGEASSAVTVSASLRREFDLDGEQGHRDEICDLDVAWLNEQLDLNLEEGNQIRIRRSGGTAGQKGACTIQDHPGAGSVVRMGYEGFRRIEVTPPTNETTSTAIILDSNVTHATYGRANDSAARSEQEFYDDVVETDANQREVVVLAPHGGQIELRTDKQANTHFYNQLPAGRVTSWQANGYNASGEGDPIKAPEHWHITSTALDPTGFRTLAGVTDRRFKYPVAFHGYESKRNNVPFHANEVLVGGRESPLFRQEIAEMITLGARNPQGLGITITGRWSGLPPDLAGTDTTNIVNWIGTNGKGLQLEQSSEARGVGGTTDYSDRIAKAVGAVYRCLLDPPRSARDTSAVGASISFNHTAQGTICDRHIVDVTISSTETSSFSLVGQISESVVDGLTQAQCQQFEGYVSIYKEVSGRWDRLHGGHIDAAWSGSSCNITLAPGSITISPPPSGTVKYRVTVKGAHGSSLPMTPLQSNVKLTRLP